MAVNTFVPVASLDILIEPPDANTGHKAMNQTAFLPHPIEEKSESMAISGAISQSFRKLRLLLPFKFMTSRGAVLNVTSPHQRLPR
jgi:hypothetical protein